MKIKTVAIIGAGAIGSYFIAGLTEKLGDDLWIVADTVTFRFHIYSLTLFFHMIPPV